MAIATLDIELDDFHSSDIIAEILRRVKDKPFHVEQLKQITEVFLLASGSDLKVKYADDEAKLQYLLKAVSQYDLAELESKLPLKH